MTIETIEETITETPQTTAEPDPLPPPTPTTPAPPEAVEPLLSAAQFCLASKIKWHRSGGFLAEVKATMGERRHTMKQWAGIYETYRARPVR